MKHPPESRQRKTRRNPKEVKAAPVVVAAVPHPTKTSHQHLKQFESTLEEMKKKEPRSRRRDAQTTQQKRKPHPRAKIDPQRPAE